MKMNRPCLDIARSIPQDHDVNENPMAIIGYSRRDACPSMKFGNDLTPQNSDVSIRLDSDVVS